CAEALKDSPAHALRARLLRAEDFLRVEIFGDDRSHRSGLDAPRADGGPRPAHRFLIFEHEGRRPRQTAQTHGGITTTAQIAVGEAGLFIDKGMTKFRITARHCCFTLSRSASHGFVASVGSGSPKCSVVPSGVVMLVTALPVAFSACVTSVRSVGLRGLRGLDGLG